VVYLARTSWMALGIVEFLENLLDGGIFPVGRQAVRRHDSFISSPSVRIPRGDLSHRFLSPPQQKQPWTHPGPGWMFRVSQLGSTLTARIHPQIFGVRPFLWTSLLYRKGLGMMWTISEGKFNAGDGQPRR
jgi:hypothetical protein